MEMSENVGEEDAFKRVVEYYGMTPFLYQQSFSLYRGLSGQATCIKPKAPAGLRTSYMKRLSERISPERSVKDKSSRSAATRSGFS